MRTFYPRKTVSVPASAPHPDGTIYKLSVGDEDWGDGTFQSVIKVQMEYDGKVAGRKSPSYPVGSGDWKKVAEAIQQMVDDEIEVGEPDEHRGKDTYMVPMMLTRTGLLLSLDEIIGLTEDRPSSQKTRYADCHTGFISYKMTNVFEYMFDHLADELKLLCDFNEPEGLKACDEIISKLQELETDDDFFPQNEIEDVENIKDLVAERKKR